MKRSILLGLAVLMLVGSLSNFYSIHIVLADSTSPCAALTLDNPHSDECNADIAANPLPDLVRPTKPNPKMDGYSKPRSILLPKSALPHKIGWMIHDWYYSDKPGQVIQADEMTKDRFYAKSILVYIYATVKVNGLDWNMVGADRWIPGEYVAVLNIPKRPDGVSGRWITLDLSEQTLLAFEDDMPIFATLISAAWGNFGVTREGIHHIYARTIDMTFRGPPWAKVPEYIIPHVPYVMFFDKDIALHGAYWHNYFGYERTHGCVNIPVADEKWLWDWVGELSDQWGPEGTGNSFFFFAHPENAPWVYVYKSNPADEANFKNSVPTSDQAATAGY